MLCWLINFLDSNFFQSIVMILVAVLTVVLGFHYFFIKQKSIRLQSLYYDDSLKKHAAILNENISTILQNHAHFAGFLDYIDNFSDAKNRDYLLKLLEDKIDVIKPPIPLGLTEGAINFLFTDASAHLAQWIFKSQKDFDSLYGDTKEQLLVTYKKISEGEIPDDNRLKQTQEQISHIYISAERHYVLKNLFDVLVRNFVEFDFENSKDLKKIIKKQSIEKDNIYKKIDECFKLLFGFYKKTGEEDTWYSYARREDGKCFKIKFSKMNDKISIISAEAADSPSQFANQKPTLILFDEILGGIKIGDDILIRILINLTYAKIGFKKPDILPFRSNFL